MSNISGKLFTACGIWLLALGIYFLLLRPALLPEDPRFMGVTIETLRATVPGLERWLGHVFNVMGGFMVAAGALTVLVARRHTVSRSPGTFAALAIAGVAGVGLMSATNLLLQSDFQWLLLAPPALWLAALVCFWLEGSIGA